MGPARPARPTQEPVESVPPGRWRSLHGSRTHPPAKLYLIIMTDDGRHPRHGAEHDKHSAAPRQPARSPAAPGVLNRRLRAGISGHRQPPAAGPAWTPRWALLGRAQGPGPRGHWRPGPGPSPIPCCPLLSPSLSSKAEKQPPSPMGEGPPTVLEDTSPHPPAAAKITSPAPPPIPAASGCQGVWEDLGTPPNGETWRGEALARPPRPDPASLS